MHSKKGNWLQLVLYATVYGGVKRQMFKGALSYKSGRYIDG